MEEYQMKKSKTNENELNNKNVNEEDEIAAYVVSAETMEITDTFRYGDSYKKKTKEDKKKILEFLAQEDECEVFNDGVSFVKLYDDILDELNKHLSLAEFNFTIRLAKHVSFRDCILRTNGNPHGKILDAKDIAALLEMDDSNVRRLISSLVKKGVLGRHITGCKDDPSIQFKTITCNPFIFTRGNKVNNTAMSLFINSKWNTTKEESRDDKSEKVEK